MNLKKLIYNYKYLRLELDDRKEEHSTLSKEFESLFSEFIPKPTIGENTEVVHTLKEPTESEVETHSVDIKRIYKLICKKLHPDVGGDDDTFKDVVERYKAHDILGLVVIAIDNNIEVNTNDIDVSELNKSIDTLNDSINWYKSKLAYVWKYGNAQQRMVVLRTLAGYIGTPIDISTLSDEIKEKLNLDNSK